MNNRIQRISAQDFLNLPHRTGQLLVMDVRTAAEVNSECFDNCVNIPLHELTAQKLKSCIAEKGVSQEDPVYLLCGTGKRAQAALEQLQADIPHSLLVIEGGIQAMKQAGCRLQKGPRPVISLERQVRIAAGLLVVVGVLFGALLSPLFYGLSAFVGIGLMVAGITDSCAMGLLLARMPWNRTA